MKATALIEQQHREVESLFESIEASKANAKLIEQLATALTAHAVIEEQIFYPAAMKMKRDLVLESYEEHELMAYALKRLVAADPKDELPREGEGRAELVEEHAGRGARAPARGVGGAFRKRTRRSASRCRLVIRRCPRAVRGRSRGSQAKRASNGHRAKSAGGGTAKTAGGKKETTTATPTARRRRIAWRRSRKRQSSASFRLSTRQRRSSSSSRRTALAERHLGPLPDRAGRAISPSSTPPKRPRARAAGAGTGGPRRRARPPWSGSEPSRSRGSGPFIAAGPLMATLSGAAIGAGVGGVTGALIGDGRPELEAKLCPRQGEERQHPGGRPHRRRPPAEARACHLRSGRRGRRLDDVRSESAPASPRSPPAERSSATLVVWGCRADVWIDAIPRYAECVNFTHSNTGPPVAADARVPAMPFDAGKITGLRRMACWIFLFSAVWIAGTL